MESYGFQVQAMGVPAGLAVPPIQNQPIVKEGTIWMPIPPSLPNCPPGLEYLTQVPAPFLLPQRTGIHLRSSLHPSRKLRKASGCVAAPWVAALGY